MSPLEEHCRCLFQYWSVAKGFFLWIIIIKQEPIKWFAQKVLSDLLASISQLIPKGQFTVFSDLFSSSPVTWRGHRAQADTYWINTCKKKKSFYKNARSQLFHFWLIDISTALSFEPLCPVKMWSMKKSQFDASWNRTCGVKHNISAYFSCELHFNGCWVEFEVNSLVAAELTSKMRHTTPPCDTFSTFFSSAVAPKLCFYLNSQSFSLSKWSKWERL